MSSKYRDWKNIPSIGGRLEYLRVTTGKNQSEFAHFIKVSPSAISTVERDESAPGYKIVMGLIAKIPNLNLDWFYTGEGNYQKGEDHFKAIEQQLSENEEYYKAKYLEILEKYTKLLEDRGE